MAHLHSDNAGRKAQAGAAGARDMLCERVLPIGMALLWMLVLGLGVGALALRALLRRGRRNARHRAAASRTLAAGRASSRERS